MGKKYLLYIHDERFNAVVKKSQLVNELLENFYKDTLGVASVPPLVIEKKIITKTRPTREKNPPQPIKSVIPTQKPSKPVKQKKIIKTPEDAKKAVEQAPVRAELPRSILSGDPGDCPRHHVALNLCRDMH